VGLLLTAAVAIVLAVGFDLNSIASIGSAVALLVFTLVTAAHLRIRRDTGANVALLVVGVASTSLVLLAFVFTTLVDEPATALALVCILTLSVALDWWWKRTRDGRPTAEGGPVTSGAEAAEGGAR
jgi:L-asparagine transporter-like permease